MAKYTLSNGTTRFKGTRGGTTFTRTPNGFIIRKRFMPVIVRNARTTNQRLQFNAASTFYRKLSEGQKQGFRDQAQTSPKVNSLGQTYFLNGQQRQISQNKLRLQVGNPPSTTAYPDVVIDTPLLIGGGTSISPFALTLSFSPNPVTNDQVFQIGASRIGVNKFPVNETPSLPILISLQTGTPSPVSLTVPYIERYGSPVVDAEKNILLSIQAIHKTNGQKSGRSYILLEFN